MSGSSNELNSHLGELLTGDHLDFLGFCQLMANNSADSSLLLQCDLDAEKFF